MTVEFDFKPTWRVRRAGAEAAIKNQNATTGSSQS